MEANLITKEAQKDPTSGIRIMPIAPEKLRVGVATDASWGNSKCIQAPEASTQDYWEETKTSWIRHHISPRKTFFHPGMVAGPDLHDLLPLRVTVRGEEQVEDDWTKATAFGKGGDSLWTGRTVFSKQPAGKILEQSQTNETFLQLMSWSSQGGFIMMYYDKDLEVSKQAEMVSVAGWKSTRLKRRTVNTLSAECQSMVMGIGYIHWHRYLLLEVTGKVLSEAQWEAQLTSIPFVAVTDSKSLFDCLSKLTCPFTQCDDKRTAIDISILKDDVSKTAGHVRWVEGKNMLADSLTKKMGSEFLRSVCNSGRWALSKEGHSQLCTEHDVLLISM